jgi:ABC-2 type transport system ATP-binding protein
MTSAGTTEAFAITGVSRSFPHFALQELTLSLPLGQIMGLVGPNGAGKSPTIRLLMGLLAPDAGRIEVLGHAVPAQVAAAKRDVAFVSDDMRLFGIASIAWHMQWMASLYEKWDGRYAEELLRRFNLRREQKVKSLSRGELVKAMLLLALARQPKLLVLDEPTSGLDPVARHELLTELMQIVRDEHRSILFSSHQTADVERISDVIAFIDRGRLVDARDKESFIERWRRLVVDVPAGVVLPRIPGVADLSLGGRVTTLTTDRYEADIKEQVERAGARLSDVQRMTLEEIFVASVMRSRQEGSV